MKIVREHILEDFKILKGPSEEEQEEAFKKFRPEKMLIFGAKYGKIRWVKMGLLRGADIHESDDYALGLAAQNGHLEIVKYLVEKGANIHAWEEHPLRTSIYNGYLEIVKFLLNSGAKIHSISKGELFRLSRVSKNKDVYNFIKNYLNKIS